MFKKVYVEITNICNLNCTFCPGNKRDKKFLSLEDFDILLDKLEGHTKYLYFHVMGEPLTHPNINELIDVAFKRYFINITSNGYLIKKVEDIKNIRQLNISLHSFDLRYGKSLDNYLNDIFDAVDKLKENTYINYRIWTEFEFKDEILKRLSEKYNTVIDDKHIKIDNNVFLDFDETFEWPSLSNEYYNEVGTCYGTRSHIGVLVDGTVIPCCLDSNGIINLGNIYKQDLDDIISSDKFLEMKNGFLNNKKICELCKRCHFIDIEK